MAKQTSHTGVPVADFLRGRGKRRWTYTTITLIIALLLLLADRSGLLLETGDDLARYDGKWFTVVRVVDVAPVAHTHDLQSSETCTNLTAKRGLLRLRDSHPRVAGVAHESIASEVLVHAPGRVATLAACVDRLRIVE